MLLVQLSDLHVIAPGRQLSGFVDTGRLFANAVSAILGLQPRPDAVLITGDLVDAGGADEYAHLRTLLAPLPMPVYVLPGNHDEVGAFRDAFADHGYLPASGPLHWVVDTHPVRLIGLDSTIAGEGGGCLDEHCLAWLDQTLGTEPKRCTIVALHHPPFASGIVHMDRIGLSNSVAFEAVIRRHPQVERVLSGHVHRSIQRRFGGTIALSCPSTAHQIEFNLHDTHRGGFIMETPGFQAHTLTADGSLASHVIPVGTFSGPHRFHSN